jgi:hypothetical protein
MAEEGGKEQSAGAKFGWRVIGTLPKFIAFATLCFMISGKAPADAPQISCDVCCQTSVKAFKR